MPDPQPLQQPENFFTQDLRWLDGRVQLGARPVAPGAPLPDLQLPTELPPPPAERPTVAAERPQRARRGDRVTMTRTELLGTPYRAPAPPPAPPRVPQIDGV